MANLHKILVKNRWLKNNLYSILEDKENNCLVI